MENNKVFLGNLTTNNPYKASKIIRMLTKIKEKDVDTVLFLNIDGVKIADKVNYKEECPVTKKPVIAILKNYISKGGKVIIGPDCMKVAGVKKENLLENITMITEPEILFDILLDDNIKIISYS